jgi:hypothetical protein
MTVTANADGTVSYVEDTTLQMAGDPEPMHHTDSNTLRRIP